MPQPLWGCFGGAWRGTCLEVILEGSRLRGGFGLNIDEGIPLTDGAEYTFEFSMLDAEGQPMTVTKTARWSAS